MDFTTTIKELRHKAKASQQEVAEAVGMARATYASLESDKRPPNLDEIQRLADYYHTSVSDLVTGNLDATAEHVSPYEVVGEAEITPRELNPTAKPEKLREVLLYVLERVGAKPNVGETVLYKLLYFIDFDYYEKHGQSITGLTYLRNHFGPTPSLDFKRVVEGMERAGELERIDTKYFNSVQKKYLPAKKAELRELDASELEHINETLARLSDKSATELSERSHLDTPWRVAKQGKPIEYRFVYYRTALTAVTEPKDEL